MPNVQPISFTFKPKIISILTCSRYVLISGATWFPILPSLRHALLESLIIPEDDFELFQRLSVHEISWEQKNFCKLEYDFCLPSLWSSSLASPFRRGPKPRNVERSTKRYPNRIPINLRTSFNASCERDTVQQHKELLRCLYRALWLQLLRLKPTKCTFVTGYERILLTTRHGHNIMP